MEVRDQLVREQPGPFEFVVPVSDQRPHGDVGVGPGRTEPGSPGDG
jgi:hypothetical protein